MVVSQPRKDADVLIAVAWKTAALKLFILNKDIKLYKIIKYYIILYDDN